MTKTRTVAIQLQSARTLDAAIAALARAHDESGAKFEGESTNQRLAPTDARMGLQLLVARVREAWNTANPSTRSEAQRVLRDVEPDDWIALTHAVQDPVAYGWQGCLANALAVLAQQDHGTSDDLAMADSALLAGTLPPAPRHPDEALRGLWAAAEPKSPEAVFNALVNAEEITQGALIQGPKELRRAKDLLVASSGARMRFSRKHGLVLLDRGAGVRGQGAFRLEDRTDQGALDRFEAVEGERPRLFDPKFLKPVLHVRKKGEDLLVLRGWLGRGPGEIPCRMVWTGREDGPLTLRVALHNDRCDHRVRMRFLGLPRSFVTHRCADVFESVHERGATFLAATLLRSCGRLQVDQGVVATPGALGLGWIEHTIVFGED